MSSVPTETSVYIHFPWCARKCPYCDFATEPIRAPELPHEAYADALLRELDARAADLQGRSLKSVFFGGGTPSLWAPASLARVLEGIRRVFEAEVDRVIEALPTGQAEPTGTAQAPRQLAPLPYYVRLRLKEDVDLPVGAVGAAGIYTSNFKTVQVIRRVMMHMEAWKNYVVPN